MSILRRLKLRKFKPSKRIKTWFLLALILMVAFFAANLDYPNYWNNFIDGSFNQINTNVFNESGISGKLLDLQPVGLFYAGVLDNYEKLKFERDFSLGLDLQGGIHLIYEADLSDIDKGDEENAVGALRDAIERRVNFLGVSEPVVQVQKSRERYRLIVELAGISDTASAIEQIGQTPFLEFKEIRPFVDQERIILQALPELEESQVQQFCQTFSTINILAVTNLTGEDPCFASTGLTGRYLERSEVASHPQTGEIQVILQFNGEGAKLFEEITERNVGDVLAIYLDQVPVSIPRVNQKITGGNATITGNFTIEEAKRLTSNLNSGALPVPIKLISQQSIGASLGEKSLQDSLRAGFIGLITLFIFLIIIYRFSGFLAVLSLMVYLSFLIALIKLIPITLTLAGIAGLILSIGMAVDANVLVFERLKEELAPDTKNISRAIDKAFSRAWPSIRDGNISTLLTAVILFWFSTSFVQGFALTLGLGILISLFSTMVLTKLLMKASAAGKLSKFKFIWTR